MRAVFSQQMAKLGGSVCPCGTVPGPPVRATVLLSLSRVFLTQFLLLPNEALRTGRLTTEGMLFHSLGGRTESKRSAGWLLRGALSDGQPQAALAGRGGSQQPSAPLGYRHISPCARLHGAFLCVRSAPLMRTQVPGFGLTLTQYNTSQPDHTRRDPASM